MWKPLARLVILLTGQEMISIRKEYQDEQTNFEVLVLDTCVIFSDPLSKEKSILWGEAVCSHWAVREVPRNENPPYECQTAKNLE